MLPAIRPPRAELEGVEDRSWVLNYAILLKDPDASSSRQKLKMIGRLGVVRKGPREHVHWERYGGGGEELALGYGVSPDWWGRGVMAEAMGGFLELYWGLEGEIACLKESERDRKGEENGEDYRREADDETENKHVHELVAQVDVENLASQRVMQKAGAEMRVPVVKDGYMLHGNRKRDMQVWGLKRPGSTVEGGGGD